MPADNGTWLVGRCFIVEEPTGNKAAIADPSAFGEVVHIFPAGASRPSIYDSAAIGDMISDRLHELKYDPVVDYLVIGGGLLLMAHTCAVIGNGLGNFKALMWDMARCKYNEGVLG